MLFSSIEQISMFDIELADVIVIFDVSVGFGSIIIGSLSAPGCLL